MPRYPAAPVAAVVWVAAIVGVSYGGIGPATALIAGLVLIMVPRRSARITGGVIVVCGILLWVSLVRADSGLATERNASFLASSVEVTLHESPTTREHSLPGDRRLYARAELAPGSCSPGQEELCRRANTLHLVFSQERHGKQRETLDVATYERNTSLTVSGRVEVKGTLVMLEVHDVQPRKPQRNNTWTQMLLHEPVSGLAELRTGIRQRFDSATAALPTDERSLVRGFVIGDATGLSPPVKEAMVTSGLTHLVAASGANIALVYGAVTIPLLYGGINRRVRVGAGTLGIIFYVWIVGPEPSLVRAATMAAPLLIARFVGFRTPALNALALAVTWWSIASPELSASYGFVLSVLATAGILAGARPAAKALRELTRERLTEGAALACAVPLVAQAVCTPVLILLAPEVSLWAVPANVLAEFLVIPATLLGFGALILACVWTPAAVPPIFVSGSCAHVLAALARYSESLPGAHIGVPEGQQGAVLLALALAAGTLLWCLRRERAVRIAVAFVTVLALCGWTLRGPLDANRNDWLLAACDVGQGDALVIRSKNRKDAPAILIDTGPNDADLIACLDQLEITEVALLIVTHPHADHAGGIGALRGARKPGRVWSCPLDNQTRAGHLDVPPEYPLAGHREVVAGVSLAILWPTSADEARRLGNAEGGGEESALNDCSLVVRAEVTGNGKTLSLVALGDLEPKAQRALSREELAHALVVKVAHHGSRRQYPMLYAKLRPRIALVPVGKNSFGHPHRDTLGLLRLHGATVLRTDHCGTISISAPTDVGIPVKKSCR